jgi:hypothetical protein
MFSDLPATLAEVAHAFGLPDLIPNERNQVAFTLGDGLTITMILPFQEGATGRIIGEIARIADNAFDDMAQAMLALNGRLVATAGASFALHPTNGSVLVVLPFVDSQIEPQSFRTLVEQFIELCRMWNDKILRSDSDLSLETRIVAALDRSGIE